MDRKKAHFQEKEPILEQLVRFLRYKNIYKHIPNNPNVLDLGCGYNAHLLKQLSNRIKKGIGIDREVTKNQIAPNITLIQTNVESKLEFNNNSFDLVTMLALIEHITNRNKLLSECYRVLKKGGLLLLTTPSLKARKLLEILAYRFKLLSSEEIKDHKHYYTKNTIKNDLLRAGFNEKDININKFILGYNLFVKAQKR